MSKDSEGTFYDSVVYVTKQGSQVGVDGGRITVYMKDEGEIASFPMGQVDTINIFGNINFTTPFVARANEHGIVLNYFTQNGDTGQLLPEKNTIAEVRRCQYALSEKRLRLQRDHPRQDQKLAYSANARTSTIQEAGRFETGTIGARDWMGCEEGWRRIYFGLQRLPQDGWTFEKRTRRPPEDHINALLSLTYSMMKNEVLSALRQYNLDPFLGILHADRHGRPSLALDLQEEFRPIFCDAFALRLINKSMLKHEDFQVDNHLKDYAFKIYLEKFDDYMQEEFIHPRFGYTVSRRKAVRLQAILLRKAITGELKKYYPLEFRK